MATSAVCSTWHLPEPAIGCRSRHTAGDHELCEALAVPSTECRVTTPQGDAGHPTGAEPHGIETPDLARDLQRAGDLPRLPAVSTCSGIARVSCLRSKSSSATATPPSRNARDRRAPQGDRWLPTPRQINDLLTTDFFLPFANKAAHKEMREKARC